MRYTTVFLNALIWLVTSACKNPETANPPKPLANSASARVPLPLSTPFYGIPGERAAYLSGYVEGYRDGFAGFHGPPWKWVGERYDLTEPRTRGWVDGSLAARLDAAMKLRKEE